MKKIGILVGGVLAVILLAINYYTNILLPNDDMWEFMYDNSEMLVTGKMMVSDAGVRNRKYGLGYMCDSVHYIQSYEAAIGDDINKYLFNSEDYTDGYSNDGKSVALNTNPYVGRWATEGNIIEFEDGTCCTIERYEEDAAKRIVFFQGNPKLSKEKNGDLWNISFHSTDGYTPAKVDILQYRSQVGLQGYLFDLILNDSSNEHIFMGLHLICCTAMAFTAVIMVVLLAKKYDLMMAVIYYLFFLLSPIVVDFAHNAYWLEFLWFWPMIIGLIMTLCDKRWQKNVCIALAYVIVFVKSASGYEYISAVLVSMMLYPFTDYIWWLSNKCKNRKTTTLVDLIKLGTAGVGGFFTAVVWHAGLRGDGDIFAGLRNIYVEDVLRSTFARWSEEYGASYINSMSSSFSDVLKAVFLQGDYGMLGIIPKGFLLFFVAGAIICLLLNRCMFGKDIRTGMLLLISTLAALSWFVLAKSHTCMHASLNYVLCYLGMAQMTIYAICEFVAKCIRRRKISYNTVEDR